MQKLKLFDYTAVILSAAVVIIFSIYIYSDRNEPAVVKIECCGKVWLYPLDADRELHIEGPIGITEIRIEKNSVYINDSPCPDKLCVLAGKLEKTGQWAACLPNRVFVSIEGAEDEEIDELNY